MELNSRAHFDLVIDNLSSNDRADLLGVLVSDVRYRAKWLCGFYSKYVDGSVDCGCIRELDRQSVFWHGLLLRLQDRERQRKFLEFFK